MSSSEFAQKQLKKHGWKEGSGLGREEHGRTEAIKVTLKMDKAGVGHDPGKEFSDHWWMRAFNDAAKQTGVKEKKVEIEEKKQESEQSARKKRFYSGFVKSTVLSNGVEERDKDKESTDEDEEEKPLERLPTLDELHKENDGATGHRAFMAYGGIKMSGKLARVKEADRLFELRMKEKEAAESHSKTSEAAKTKTDKLTDSNVSIEDLESTEGSKKKKKKKKKSKDSADDSAEDKEEVVELVTESETQNKKKKKKKKNKENEEISGQVEETHDVQEAEISDEMDVHQKKKKKKRKHEKEVEDESEEVVEDQPKHKKKKKKKNSVDES